MGKQLLEMLSHEEQILLLDILFAQQYALELISCELADIENGEKRVDEKRHQQLLHLYDRLLQNI
ncbi:antirepressor AbbA [Parageobacillus thermoglucosidasius]|uniref:Antirepressor AbbA n=1 Tax=Parageobacillus thermoglucosidasius TaxID=1426 RepID=A0AB38R475_PARTM|nr:antirepressor AbbA [Parageobacillus thermoglucosidasius]REK55215.1 MAG: antirepressor AbbA [Geobacillus sp.]UOE77271.1 antirepressor AbbA [Parageobacillus thermoglucosidasius]BDG33010.1 tyrosine recombinase XerD [Parageobacillus thermoglucosidasius]